MSKIFGIIPVRMGSTRFPGKPLKKILSIALLRHVYERSMFFKKWSPSDKLKKGDLGNMEPLDYMETIMPQILIVPLLMFDRSLQRLGYGGGYYDKSINELKKHFKKEKKSFITIGLAYSSQETNTLPNESHDMNLDYVITEREVLSAKTQTTIYKKM